MGGGRESLGDVERPLGEHRLEHDVAVGEIFERFLARSGNHGHVVARLLQVEAPV